MYIVSLHDDNLNKRTNYLNAENLRLYLNGQTKSINPSIKINGARWYLVRNTDFLEDDRVYVKPLVKHDKGDIVIGDDRYKIGELC